MGVYESASLKGIIWCPVFENRIKIVDTRGVFVNFVATGCSFLPKKPMTPWQPTVRQLTLLAAYCNDRFNDEDEA